MIEQVTKEKQQSNEESSKREEIFALARQKESELPPVNPQLQIAVVIPVYKEFKFGRITNLLADLKQQSLTSDTYEILLVVNNQAYGKKGFDGEAAQDNKDFIDYVENKKREDKFQMVHLVDCSSGELGHKDIGAVWGLGNEIGKIRFEQTHIGREGILVRLDADVAVKPDFLSSINQIYTADPTIDALTIPRLPLPIDYSSEDMYLGNAHEFVEKVISSRWGQRWDLISGPTISFRAKVHEHDQVQAYMQYKLNSDYQLGKLLGFYTRFMVASFPRVYVSDRIRHEGVDANARESFVDTRIRWRIGRDIYKGLSGEGLAFDSFHYLGLKGQMEWCETTIKTLLPDRYQKFMEYQKEEEDMMKGLFSGDIDEDIACLGTYIFAIGRILLEGC